jgi:hypothetical protein
MRRQNANYRWSLICNSAGIAIAAYCTISIPFTVYALPYGIYSGLTVALHFAYVIKMKTLKL